MKTIYAIGLALALGCGAYDGAEESDGQAAGPGDELGQVEQAWQVYCTTANPFGMNLSASSNMRRCNRNSSTDVCYFPGAQSSPTYTPYTTAIKSNWTQAQRDFLGPQAVTVVNWMDTTFRSCVTVAAPESPHYALANTANPVGSGFLEITRATTPFESIPIDPGFTSVDASRLIKMTCITPTTIPEFYAASFKACAKWEARIDYDSAMAWGSTTAQDQIILKNIFRKVEAMASGYGLWLFTGETPTNNVYVTSSKVARTALQATWVDTQGFGESSWICDYPLDPAEAAPTWVCN